MDAAEPQTALADRELLERHVARVIVKSQALDVWLTTRGWGGPPDFGDIYIDGAEADH
jgi:hypothetical protein